METWLAVVVSACVCLLIRAILSLLVTSSSKSKKSNNIDGDGDGDARAPHLPPGPPDIPLISSIVWLAKAFSQLDSALVGLSAKYGPIFTLPIASRPFIFISDRSLARHALIHKGALFSDRPPALPVSRILTSNQHDITSASYGPTWRALRRNLTSEMLHPYRVKSFSPIRKGVLDLLLHSLHSESASTDSVRVIDHFRYAMFSLLVYMCFGQRLEDKQIKDIERVHRHMLLGFNRYIVLNFWPTITRILLPKRWQELLQFLKEREDVLVPLIRARKQAKERRLSNDNPIQDDDDDDGGGGGCVVVSYVDTLLDLELPEEKRKLDEGEIVTLCAEFLNAGTDTTSTALQWIMANLVKYPQVQQRLVEEIEQVTGGSQREVKEEELQKLPYLKAVVLEGLRRHPPGHIVLPHAVTEDVVLNGHLIPRNGSVNFMVAQMGWDPEVWEDPMTFKPERFLDLDNGESGCQVEAASTFDITGTKEIRMMPFGAGRRICPAYNLAMLHLEYFVANLVSNFHWKVPPQGSVDLSEKQEFTVVMKNPLQAHITPRI